MARAERTRQKNTLPHFITFLRNPMVDKKFAKVVENIGWLLRKHD
jgi:hypothetical protein